MPANGAPAPAWHTLTPDAVLKQLQTGPAGLTGPEAARRLAQHGPNELRAAHRVSPWALLAEQFKNLLIIILLIATTLSFFLGHSTEAIVIGVIVLLAVVLGFVQEYRAERAIEALRRMAAPAASAIRDGQEVEVLARELVPGDVIKLQSGDKVPADCRLLEAVNLQIEEAALTGESVPVEKNVAALAAAGDVPLGDRRNLAYAGTTVTYGRGRAVVVGTGMQTEFGQIAQMLEDVESGKTPLQENLDKVGQALARAALVIVVVIVAIGLTRGLMDGVASDWPRFRELLVSMVIFGSALAVAVVPEALPAVVTISLAIGVQRMVKRHALMRRLQAVETLGSTSVICSDKTGTLTKDEMTVRRAVSAGVEYELTGSGYDPTGEFRQDGRALPPTPALKLLLESAVLASDAWLAKTPEGRWDVKGDPTEGALLAAAAKAGLLKEQLEADAPRIHEVPFTSESKRMTTLHRRANGAVACAKGAPEVILGACRRWLGPQGEADLTPADREAVLDAALRLAGEALRVIAIAYKPGAAQADAEHDMTFLGLLGMIDPPRPEAKAAVATCRAAGIRVVMITGDHPVTAQAVAKELGILNGGRVVTGAELQAMDDAAFARAVDGIEVYARVSPAHKLRVVTTLQGKGHVVAMTGDGVNDAPALKKADIGIAMGITGTDVSREAAAMTLTDDNFASIVAAVEEGRGIFGNIKKYLMYLLSSNIGEIGLMTGASLFGTWLTGRPEMLLPLSAVQILYVNLATDGLPALALAVDPPERDLMQRPPRNSQQGIFTRQVVALMLIGGIWSTMANLGLFAWAAHTGRSSKECMSMVFVALVLIEFLKAYSFRSERHSVLHRPFANKWLNLAICWELCLLALVIYLPLLQKPFGTFPLTLADWVEVGAVALTVLPVLEFGKFLIRRGWFAERA